MTPSVTAPLRRTDLAGYPDDMAAPLPSQARIAALTLARAWMSGNRDDGLLILVQNGITTHDPVALDFMLAGASLVSRALLSANGYNVQKTLQIMDEWIAGEQMRVNAER